MTLPPGVVAAIVATLRARERATSVAVPGSRWRDRARREAVARAPRA